MKKTRIIMATIIAAALAVFAFTACSTEDTMQQQTMEAMPSAQDADSGGEASQQTEELPAEDGTVIQQTAGSTAPLLYEDEGMPADAADIGIEKVMAIALERVPGATEADFYELEREYDDGRLEYEGSIYYGGYEYEFEIDGSTGNILQWEIDD